MTPSNPVAVHPALHALRHLRCPLDGVPLLWQGQSCRCGQGHNFDLARQGYVNLLPVQRKRSAEPGDSSEMVASRRAFLNSGHYRPLVNGLNALLLEGLPKLPSKGLLVDVGCGEGYYLSALRHHQALKDWALLGVDIGKPAIKAACGRERSIGWVVGSGADLPFEDGAIQIVLSMFCKPSFAAFAKKLAPDGYLILATSAPDHLLALRERLYDQVRQKDVDWKQAAQPHFRLLHTQQIRFDFVLRDANELHALLGMMPHYWRGKPEKKAELARSFHQPLTAAIDLQLFKPEPERT